MSSRYAFEPKPFTIGTSSTSNLFPANGGIRSVDVQNHDSTLDLTLHFGNPWCLSFDGTNDVVSCDNAATDVAIGTDGSILAGIYVATAGSGARTIFSLSDADTETAFWLKVDTNNKLTATHIVGGTANWTMTVTNALADDTFYDVKLVHNGVTPTIYIDGEAWVQTFSVTTDKTAWFGDLTGIDTCNIGALDYNSAGDADFFQGYIDYLKVVDGLGTHKSHGIRTLDLPIDEGTGTTLDDRSSNANDATVSGATWTLRSTGIVLSADSGRIFHVEDDPQVRLGVWATNTDGSGTVAGIYKLAPNA